MVKTQEKCFESNVQSTTLIIEWNMKSNCIESSLLQNNRRDDYSIPRPRPRPIPCFSCYKAQAHFPLQHRRSLSPSLAAPPKFFLVYAQACSSHIGFRISALIYGVWARLVAFICCRGDFNHSNSIFGLYGTNIRHVSVILSG